MKQRHKTRIRRKKVSVRRRQRGGNPRVKTAIKMMTKVAIAIAAMLLLYRNVPLLETLNVAYLSITGLGRLFISLILTAYAGLSGGFVNSMDAVSSMVLGVPAATAAAMGVKGTAAAALGQADFTIGIGLNIGLGITIVNMLFGRETRGPRDAAAARPAAADRVFPGAEEHKGSDVESDGESDSDYVTANGSTVETEGFDSDDPESVLYAWNVFVRIVKGGAVSAGNIFEEAVGKLKDVFRGIVDFKEGFVNKVALNSDRIVNNLAALKAQLFKDIDAASETAAQAFMDKIYSPLYTDYNNFLREWNVKMVIGPQEQGQEIGEGVVRILENDLPRMFKGFIWANDCYKEVRVKAGEFVKVVTKFNQSMCEVSTTMFYRICTYFGATVGDEGSVNDLISIYSLESGTSGYVSLLLPQSHEQFLVAARLDLLRAAAAQSPGSDMSSLTDLGSYGDPFSGSPFSTISSQGSPGPAIQGREPISPNPMGTGLLFADSPAGASTVAATSQGSMLSAESVSSLQNRRGLSPQSTLGASASIGGRKRGLKHKGGRIVSGNPIYYICIEERASEAFMKEQAYGASKDLMRGNFKDGLCLLYFAEEPPDGKLLKEYLDEYLPIFDDSIKEQKIVAPYNNSLSTLVRRASLTGGESGPNLGNPNDPSMNLERVTEDEFKAKVDDISATQPYSDNESVYSPPYKRGRTAEDSP